MRWKTPGLELKEYAEVAAQKYDGGTLYVYGAGLIGKRIVRAVLRLTNWELRGVIDRDRQKQGRFLEGIRILSLEEVLKREENRLYTCRFLIGLNDEKGIPVKREIDELFLKRGLPSPCVLYSDFMRSEFPAIISFQYNKIFVHSLSLIVTEKCTLKCKKCSIMLPYFKDTSAYPEEITERNIDLAFQKIDFIGDFTVTGGEPLLNSQLSRILSYVGKNYGERIGSFKIITNGTILPTEKLLDTMAEYKIAAEISDYTRAVPTIAEKVEATKAAFSRKGINYYFLSSAQWVDFGFEGSDQGKAPEQLAAFFDYCRTRCRGYVNGEIWYCINAGFAEKALGLPPDPDNRLSLAAIGGSVEERRKIVEFDLGYNQKGYLDMCRRCNGTCEINANYIEVGEQWESP